jgi:hypothetical protein
MAMRFGGRIDLTGMRFGSMTVIERRGSHATNLQACWLVRCDCGSESVRASHSVKQAKNYCSRCVPRGTHNTPETDGLYIAWKGMKARCSPGNKRKVKNYYQRGIRVCPQWLYDFPTFRRYVLRYLGPKPSPLHSLDRRNNDKGYEPGNIRWATTAEQLANRRPYRS